MYQFIIFLAISINLPTPHRTQCRAACLNRIVAYQYIVAFMAVARHPHAPLHSWDVPDLRPLDLKCLLGIMADSWMTNERLHSDMIKETMYAGRRLCLDPHEIQLTPKQNEIRHQAFIDNYSFGGAKISTMKGNLPIVHNWANHLPRLTIAHLGACDLSTGPQGTAEHPTTAF